MVEVTVDNNAQMEAVMERKISTITQVLYSSTIFFTCKYGYNLLDLIYYII